jgi:hypothetical protein
MTTAQQHADYLFHNVPSETLELVADALRVRAMDFVADRLRDGDTRVGDEAADTYRALEALGVVERLDLPFNPDFYAGE